MLQAATERETLRIAGSGTKIFYTRQSEGRTLNVAGHNGIVSYEPTELVITARSGTRLTDIETTLAKQDQMLGFEPPYFGEAATLGGTIACGFSGPRRPYAGAARDFVLGVKIINGKGEILNFGGQVMKNVAGYDVSRLIVGAFGTLGVLLEISLKVLPRPSQETTLSFGMPADKAITAMNTWAGQPLPLSAACHAGDSLFIRLSGTELGVRAARTKLGGEMIERGDEFWRELREHQHSFFQDNTPLWRLSVPPAVPPMNLPGKWVIDWGGAQRWLKSDAPAAEIRREAVAVGGFATPFRNCYEHRTTFPNHAPGLLALHRKLKQAFDPHSVLNIESS